MPFMRPLRLVLSLSSCVLAITILLYTTFRAAEPEGPTAARRDSAIHSLFSFHTPSSLFPPSAIISLTDDNSTFFLARPAAFGPSLPSSGLSGQLWIGSGFSDDSLSRGGIITGAEGELGCSDVPGWTGTDQKSDRKSQTPGRFSWKKTNGKLENGNNAAPIEAQSRSRRNEELSMENSGTEDDTPFTNTKDDGTDDYLHQPLSDTAITKPNTPNRRKGMKPGAHADIQSLQEGAEIDGKVVLLSRGGCGFLEKVKWVQRRGGTALIVGDDVRGGPLVTMYARGDTSNITIPALFTSRMTAHLLAGLIPSGGNIDGVPIGDDATLPGKTGPNKKFAGNKKGRISDEGQADKSGPVFTTKSTSTALTPKPTVIRGSSKPANSERVKSARTEEKKTGFIRSIVSALGLVSGIDESQRRDSRRPPSSGQVDWVLEEWKDAELTLTTTSSKSTYLTTSTAKSKVPFTTSTSGSGRSSPSDSFVIGVHDWRDPDLVGANMETERFPTSTGSSTGRPAGTHVPSTSSTVSHQLKGGSITPGSGEYGPQDDQSGDPSASRKSSHAFPASNEEARQDKSNEGTSKSWRHSWSHDGEETIDHYDSVNSQNTKSTRPHPASSNVLNSAQPRMLGMESHEGLWVTLTPTSMSSSPFFDTLLVLVVSPLVTLTVVYALLLLRSRIRRRRWRAPKSVVERLPVRTYQTLPSSTASSGSPVATPVTATSTTPLLQNGNDRSPRPRPRARTASSIPPPTLARAIATEESHGDQDEPGEGSYAQQEKRDAGLAEWRRKYGGKQRECVVCLEEYVDGVSRVMSLPCGHEFHEGCITPWLTTRRRTCPICKGDVVRSLQRTSSSQSHQSHDQNHEDLIMDEDVQDAQERAAHTRNDSPSAALPMQSTDEEPDLERGDLPADNQLKAPELTHLPAQNLVSTPFALDPIRYQPGKTLRFTIPDIVDLNLARSSPLALGLALISVSTAYPDILAHLNNVESNGKAAKRQAPGVTPPFDPSLQYVDTTGQYAFVPPGDVFGMGVDLSTFLAIYGSVFDGDLTGWSIGGPTSLVSLGGLLGEPQGISGSHNKYEGDASPTRGDLYQYGNDYLVQLSQFQALYDLGKADDNYDLQLLTDYRATRFQESIDNNPYFFNAPFSGVAAQPAAWSFIYRFMANKSAEYPEGRLTGDVLKSFYSITGEDGNFTYTPGYERIPDNWYTRHPVDAYTIPYFSLDAVAQLVQYPEFGSVGGNTGTTNSFVGIDPANLTGGVYSASNLAEGNNLLCYALELTTQETPDILSGLFTDTSAAADQIGSALNNATDSLGCPQLNSINKDQFSQFPGYTQPYDGYTDPTSGGLL
ncbi:MAG: hypothetical protein Q9165_008750 [Trypethelium subeluteriae]